MSTADSAAPRLDPLARLRGSVADNVRLALWTLLGIIVAFTPVTYLLGPDNFWPTATPKLATLAVGSA